MKIWKYSNNKFFFKIEDDIPLIGHIAFGIIDRGTNLLQIRATSFCALSCIFCSVDAGPRSRNRMTEFMVDLDYLLEWIRYVIKLKSVNDIQIHLDAVGDPFTYPYLVELVRELSKIPVVKTVSIETHGALLSQKLLDALDDAKLSRLNLSIDALDKNMAKYLAGTKWYDVEKIKDFAKYVAQSLNMDIIIAPVWIPGINDDEIPRIIEFALKIGAGKRWPPLGIQKYEVHKYGRKVKGVRELSWYAFYEKLREWEKEFGVKLVLSPKDFNIIKTKRLPNPFRRFQTIKVKVIGPGWLRNQWLGIAGERVITIVGVNDKEIPIGKIIKVKILRNKDNIYVGEIKI
ncbi:MAG: radical SAM protein [Thermoproteales archaeon]|nr:radical SAM protein [Thermoproteales archaeon]